MSGLFLHVSSTPCLDYFFMCLRPHVWTVSSCVFDPMSQLFPCVSSSERCGQVTQAGCTEPASPCLPTRTMFIDPPVTLKPPHQRFVCVCVCWGGGGGCSSCWPKAISQCMSCKFCCWLVSQLASLVSQLASYWVSMLWPHLVPSSLLSCHGLCASFGETAHKSIIMWNAQWVRSLFVISWPVFRPNVTFVVDGLICRFDWRKGFHMIIV